MSGDEVSVNVFTVFFYGFVCCEVWCCVSVVGVIVVVVKYGLFLVSVWLCCGEMV